MTKSKTFKLRLSEEQLAMIQGKAEALSMSAAAFIISCCEDADVPGYVPTNVGDVPGQMTFSDLGL